MSGTVPPPPPGHDGRPPSVPPASPATGVRRVASAYRRPTSADTAAEVPLQQVTAPSAAAVPQPTAPQATTPGAGAPTVHAPVPPPPDASPAQPAPVHQPTQQIPPAAPYAPQPGQYPPAYAAAATQVQQPVPAQAAYAQPVYAQPAPAAPGGGYPQAAAVGAPPPPPQAPRRRRRLSGGWIAFIAVDVVLVVAMVVFAVQMFTAPSPGGAQAGADTAASPTPSASASAEAPMQGEPLAHFAAPSKNITCSIYADGASCGIAELNQQPAPTEGCDGTTGYVVTVDADGKVAQPCVPAKDQPKAAGGDLDVLAYGDSITEGDFTCRSEDTGMSCTHDPSGNGFSLARAGIGTS